MKQSGRTSHIGRVAFAISSAEWRHAQTMLRSLSLFLVRPQGYAGVRVVVVSAVSAEKGKGRDGWAGLTRARRPFGLHGRTLRRRCVKGRGARKTRGKGSTFSFGVQMYMTGPKNSLYTARSAFHGNVENEMQGGWRVRPVATSTCVRLWPCAEMDG